MRPKLSLKGRGIQLLAQREHSRSELQRKLLSHALAAQAATESSSPGLSGELLTDDPTQQVAALLDWLQAQHYLSEERFVESRVNGRAARFGNLRICQELSQHGVSLSTEAAQHLKDTELERARHIWARKFGQAATDAAERAKQMRFLAGRGFSTEVIRRVVRGADDD